MSDAPGPVTPPPAPEWPRFPPAQAGPAGNVYPLDMGRIFELTFSLFRYRWQTFLGATLLVMLPVSIWLALIQLYSGTEINRWFVQLQEAVRGGGVDLLGLFPWTALVIGIVGGVIAGLGTYVALAAITRVAATTFAGREVTASQSVRGALSRFWSLAGAYVLVTVTAIAILVIGFAAATVPILAIDGGRVGPGLGFFLGLILAVAGFVALVFVTIRWAVLVQAIVLEGLGAIDGLRRSWHVVSGSTWRVLGYAVVFGLLFGLIGAVISAVVTLIITPSAFAIEPTQIDVTGAAVAGFLTSLISATLMPFPMIGFTLLYFDLRWRRGEPVPAPGGGETAGRQTVEGGPAPLG